MKARDTLAVIAVGFVVLLVYGPVLLSGRSLVDDPGKLDVSFNIMPYLSWMARSWSAGEIPLWNPHNHCGMPHLGYSHSSALYVPSVLFFSFFSYPLAGSLSIIFHTLLAAFLFYFIQRHYLEEPLLAAVSALIFVFSGIFFGMIFVLYMAGSVCAALMFWLGLERLDEKPRLSLILAAALGVALCGFAGDVELLTYVVISLFFLFMLKTRLRLKELFKNAMLFCASTALGFLIMAALALSVAETVSFSIRGSLMPYPLKMVAMGLPLEALLPTWVQPFRYYRDLFSVSAFNHGLPPSYQGFLTIWLEIWAALAAFKNRKLRPPTVVWGIMIFFTLIREWPPAEPFINAIPVLGSLHGSIKAPLMVHGLGLVMAFALLSGIGKGEKEGEATKVAPETDIPGKELTTLGLLLCAAGAVTITLSRICMGGPERSVIAALAIILGLILLLGPRLGLRLSPRTAVSLTAILMAAEVLSLAVRYLPRTNPERFQLDTRLKPAAASLSPEDRFAVFERLLSENPEQDPPPVFGFFELASRAGNLAGVSRVQPARIFLYLSLFYRDIIHETGEGEKILDLWSITNPGSLDRGRFHLFNLAGVKTVLGREMAIPYSSPYSLLKRGGLEWKSELSRNLSGQTLKNTLTAPAQMEALLATLPEDRLRLRLQVGDEPAWVSLFLKPKPGKLLFARGIPGKSSREWLVSLKAFTGRGKVLSATFLPFIAKDAPEMKIQRMEIVNPDRPLQLDYAAGEIEVFANKQALPRAFLVHDYRVFSGLEEVSKFIADPLKFHPLSLAALETEESYFKAARRGPSSPRERAIITSYSHNRAEMEVLAQSPGFLVFTDTYFPGWRAFLEKGEEKQELRIFPADLAFRAVFIPEGRHRVVWEYQPQSFRMGLWISIASILSLCLAGLIARKTLT